MGESGSRWQWRPNAGLWLLAAIMVPVLAGLGVWQLERGSEKSAQAERWAKGNAAGHWSPEEAVVGQPVILQGEYDPRMVWLLDNRTREGRRGYEVLHLFHADSTPVVINRGWVHGTGDRDRLPGIRTPTDRVSLRARITDWPEPMVLGEVDPVNPDGWPRRVARLTPEQVAEVFAGGKPAFVRIAGDDQPGALATGWESDRMGAATHYGYAAQWFALAVLLLTLTVATSFRRQEDE